MFPLPKYSGILDPKIEVEPLVADRYGLVVSAEPLPGEIDLNFRLQDRHKQYLLKISRAEPVRKDWDFQVAILEYLAQSGFAGTARILPSLGSKQIEEVRDTEGCTRLVRLHSWLEGVPWFSGNDHPESQMEALGELAGSLTTTLESFDHPGAHREFDWDLARGAWTFDHLNRFSGSRRAVVDHFHDQYREIQTDYADLPRQVIHNDVNDTNIIISPKTDSLQGIIDFGDAVYTQRINDLAVLIAYGLPEAWDPKETLLPLLRGYTSRCKLDSRELQLLYVLVGMRLVISITKAVLNRQREPENSFLFFSEAKSWRTLNAWHDRGPENIQQAIRLIRS